MKAHSPHAPKKAAAFALALFQLTLFPPAHATSITDGAVSTIVGVHAGLCLGIKGSSSEDGALLQSQNCSGSSFQQWKMEMASDNYFVIKNVGSGKCADVSNWSKDNGTNLQQWSCSYNDNQKWNISDQGNGKFAIISKYDGLAMDVYGFSKTNGARVVQWSWLSGDNQKWSFPGSSSTPSASGSGGLHNGAILTLVNLNASNCLGINGSSNGNGAQLQSQRCSGSPYQNWKLESDSNGYYSLINQGSGECIDVPDGSSSSGLALQQWGCSGSDWQKWSLTSGGSGAYFIKSKYTGKVIDVAGMNRADGASVIQWDAKSTNNTNQLWSLGSASNSGTPDSDTANSSEGPTGFAAGVTGGAGGSVVTVSTPAELKAALSDNTPRIVRVSGIIDFRNTEGTTTELGCTYSDNNCSYNGKQEKILNTGSYCTGRSLYNITYDTAGKAPLEIGSNKTLIGVGGNSGIKGKGLRMSHGVSNIVVRNLSITDINDGLIWGGDAITIVNASKIWLDHNYIARIGRQFIVTGYETAQHITISNNYLDGTSDYGHYCNQRHYWSLLLLAENQSITLANNRIHMTSGRSPKVGKQSTASSAGIVHMVNNYFDKNYGQGFSSDNTAVVLMEGNYYAKDDYFVPITDDSINTPLFAPLDASIGSANGTCQAVLGRNCQSNYDGNGAANFVINSWALSEIQKNGAWLDAVKSVTPKSYSSVTSQSFGPQSSISY